MVSTIDIADTSTGDAAHHPSPLSDLTFALVGAGRLGVSLAQALRVAGGRLVGFTCRTSAGVAGAADLLAISGSTDISAFVRAHAPAVDLFILCVPDSALRHVAAELAAALPERARGIAVMHTSGATSTTVLRPCADRGCYTLSFHPLQTFSDPALGADRFPGITVAITPGPGPDETAARRLGERLARAIGALPVRLNEEHRVLYHAAATMASNYLVTLSHVAEDLLCRAGFPGDAALPALLPLIRGAVDNLDRQGSVAALTGPLSRGDSATVTAHLDALAYESPAVSTLYRDLGLATLDIVRARSELSPESIDRLTHALTAIPA